jgi:subtilisin family serine protease
VIKRLLVSLTALFIALPRAVFALTPNDPDFSRQWYAQKMALPAAWDYTQGSSDVVVAVLDTGVDIKHPELAANIWTNPREIPGNGIDDDGNGFIDDVHGWNFVENNDDPSPQFASGWTEAGITHGTVVAGIIGAIGNNISGISGVNWRVKIMPLRILDSQGIGDSANAARAIDYAVANGAKVLNFSFVTDEHNVSLDEAIARAAKAGVLVVAAAGNNRDTGGDSLDKRPMYPVCADGAGTNYVIGVAATDEDDVRADFSNFGANCVDISAPGENIISTQLYNPSLIPFSSYTRSGWSGTSVASPMVSGLAALMLSANPGLSRETLVQYMLSTADPIDAINPIHRGELGVGRINAERAIKAALGLPVLRTSTAPVVPANAPVKPYVAMGANAGNAPEVRVYTADGKLVSKFMAYAPSFKGGVRVAAGDVDGDGNAEIVTTPGPTGGPHVRVFDLKGNLKWQFFAYASGFRGGVYVAVADVDRDGKAEIITTPGPGGGPHVRIFSANGEVERQFFAYDQKGRTGITVGAGDLDLDGKAEVVVGPASAAGSLPVKYFSMGKESMDLVGEVTFLQAKATGGVTIAVGDVGNGPAGDIILGRTGSSYVTIIYSGTKPAPAFSIPGLKGNSFSALDLSGYGRSYVIAGLSAAGKIKMFNDAGALMLGLNVSIPYAVGASVAGFLSP